MRRKDTPAYLRKLMLATCICALSGTLALAACSSGNASSEAADEAQDQAVQTQQTESTEQTSTAVTSDGTLAADFTDRSTGLYPDVQTNAQYQNSGNRGCAACHTDLFDLDKDNGTYTHITTYIGLKSATYNGDCVVCHNISTGTAGNAMAENLHITHYSSTAFVEANGNCWSCHLMTRNEDGDNIFTLFEDVQYEASFGGYPGSASYSADTDQTWNARRGWDTGFLSGVSVTSEPTLEVSLDQAANAEEDEFLIQNFLREDGDDTYADIDPETWKLEVITPSGSQYYSLDDLRAMPQTEYNGAQWCLVCGYNTAMIDNMPMKGVLLKDFLEEIGVSADELNTIALVSADEWTAIMPTKDVTFSDGSSLIAGYGSLQSYVDANAMIVIENYGHDLTVPQGGPAKLFVPGTGGTITVKNLVGMEFSSTSNPSTVDGISQGFIDKGITIDINSSWFDNDGVTGKVGQTLTLEGASYGWHVNSIDCSLAKIEFSFDYGQTWTSYDVPQNFDPDQWVHYTVNWTPEEAGTYIVKVRAVDINGTEQATNSSIIVTIEE